MSKAFRAAFTRQSTDELKRWRDLIASAAPLSRKQREALQAIDAELATR